MPLDPPILLYTQRQLFPTNCFVTKYSHGNVNPFLGSAGLFLNDCTTDNSVQNNELNQPYLSVYVLWNAPNCIRAPLDFQDTPGTPTQKITLLMSACQ